MLILEKSYDNLTNAFNIVNVKNKNVICSRHLAKSSASV